MCVKQLRSPTHWVRNLVFVVVFPPTNPPKATSKLIYKMLICQILTKKKLWYYPLFNFFKEGSD